MTGRSFLGSGTKWQNRVWIFGSGVRVGVVMCLVPRTCALVETGG
jgi:hypothetical protein